MTGVCFSFGTSQMFETKQCGPDTDIVVGCHDFSVKERNTPFSFLDCNSVEGKRCVCGTAKTAELKEVYMCSLGISVRSHRPRPTAHLDLQFGHSY